jgi:hypothetical protein
MKPRSRAEELTAALERARVFRVREHALNLARGADGRWTVSVDGGPVPGTFRTQADAWEAGVRAVDALDRMNAAPG